MTQRIFDVENEKDMQDLWNILPDDVYSIKRGICDSDIKLWYKTKGGKTSADCYIANFLKINWHNKTYITRPIQEATEQDIGKLCAFYDKPDKTDDKLYIYYAVLRKIENQGRNTCFYTDRCDYFTHCRRLTKQEIEELC